MIESFDWTPVLVLLVGVPAILFLPYFVMKLVGKAKGANRAPQEDTPARRIVTSTCLSMGACLVIGVALRESQPGMQVFEASGVARKIGLPLAYGLFALAILLPHRKKRFAGRIPLWWAALLTLLFLSVVMSVIMQRQPTDLSAEAQSSVFIIGLLIVSAIGFRASEWTPREEYLLLLTLAAFGLLAGFFRLSLGPYVATVIPVAAMLLYASRRSSRNRFVLFLLGAGLGVFVWLYLGAMTAPSIATLTQFGVCAAILILLVFPAQVRLLLAFIATVGAVIFAFSQGIWGLMMGDWMGTKDVTLAHRAYEALQVRELISADPISFLFGLGPSATVDLTYSPDARTLLSSGRTLDEVDDVHFLTSWVFLKLGLLGVAWFIGIMFVMVREARHILAQTKPSLFDVSLLLFVASGVVTALPAATYFFSNPLPALLLAVLYARRIGPKPGLKASTDTFKPQLVKRKTYTRY